MTKSYERIKNFSTAIAVVRTIAEIEKMLAKYGATKIMKEYDLDGNPAVLIFGIMTERGEMPIRLPIKVDKIMDVFKLQVSNNKLPGKFWGTDWAKEQAARVGWRIIKDWLDAQLTLLNIEMVKVEEIFLPYMYYDKLGKTVFELLEERNFDLALLASHDDRKKVIDVGKR